MLSIITVLFTIKYNNYFLVYDHSIFACSYRSSITTGGCTSALVKSKGSNSDVLVSDISSDTDMSDNPESCEMSNRASKAGSTDA